MQPATRYRLPILILLTITAVIHLQLNFPDPMFILNGLGYLVLGAALYGYIPQVSDRHVQIRWLLIAFTAITVIAWLAIGARSTIGYIDKLVEVLLIVLLWLESRETQ